MLFVRCADGLIDALDELLSLERAARPGVTLSRADLVRELLYGELKRRGSWESNPDSV